MVPHKVLQGHAGQTICTTIHIARHTERKWPHRCPQLNLVLSGHLHTTRAMQVSEVTVKISAALAG